MVTPMKHATKRLRISLLAVVAAATLCGCTRRAERCVTGQSVGCVCTDGRTGSQVCRADGTYGECICTSAALPPSMPIPPPPVMPAVPSVPGMPAMPSMPLAPPGFPGVPGFPASAPGAAAATCAQTRACCAAIAADPALQQLEGICQMGAWGGAMGAGNPQFSDSFCAYIMTSVSGMLSMTAIDAQQHGRSFTYPAACRAVATP